MVQGKVVIITGSSTGIGATIATKFAQEGAAGITLHGRQEEKLQNVKKQCEQIGGKNIKVHVVVGDISEQNIRKQLVEETVKVFGKLDILVNNAAISKVSPICEAALEIFDQIFDVNVRAVIALTQLAVPHLIKSQGNVVNIGSGASLMSPAPAASFYSMSKTCLDKLTQHFAVQLGPQGVRVNCVLPGLIPGTELRRLDGQTIDPAIAAIRQKTIDKAPLKRPGRPEEIANAVVFMSSEKAAFVTGTLFPVDGGLVV